MDRTRAAEEFKQGSSSAAPGATTPDVHEWVRTKLRDLKEMFPA